MRQRDAQLVWIGPAWKWMAGLSLCLILGILAAVSCSDLPKYLLLYEGLGGFAAAWMLVVPAAAGAAVLRDSTLRVHVATECLYVEEFLGIWNYQIPFGAIDEASIEHRYFAGI